MEDYWNKHPNIRVDNRNIPLHWYSQMGMHCCCKRLRQSQFRDMGVGITAYFKFLTFMMFMFLWFSFLSIPAYVLYSSGNQSDNFQKSSFKYALSALTLGNIGQCKKYQNDKIQRQWTATLESGMVLMLRYNSNAPTESQSLLSSSGQPRKTALNVQRKETKQLLWSLNVTFFQWERFHKNSSRKTLKNNVTVIRHACSK